MIAACLIVDQLIDNIFAPRILGDAVGLNPIWILLSLLVGAQLEGVVGAVIAVPLAGSIKQIIDSLEAKPAVILVGTDQASTGDAFRWAIARLQLPLHSEARIIDGPIQSN